MQEIKIKENRMFFALFAIILLLILIFNQPILGLADKILKVTSKSNLQPIKPVKIDKTFTTGDTTLTFKEVLADGTGTTMTFEFNKSNYRIENMELSGPPGAGSYNLEHREQEGTIYFDELDEGMLKIKISSIAKYNEDKLVETRKVDWELPLNIIHQETKEVNLDKVIKFAEGEILLEKLNLGLRSSEITYSFKPKGKGDFELGSFIAGGPRFLIYTDQKLYQSSSDLYKDNFDGTYQGTIRVNSLTRKDTEKINLVLAGFLKVIPLNQEISLNQNLLPVNFKILGTKAMVTEIKTETNKTKIHLELGKENRAFWTAFISLKPPENQVNEWGASGNGISDKISRPNDKQREQVYHAILQDLPPIHRDEFKKRWPKEYFDVGLVSYELETENIVFENPILVIDEVQEFIFYNEKVEIRIP